MISRSSLFEYTVGALFFAAVGFSLGQTGIVSSGGMLAEVSSSGCTATVNYSMHPSTPFFKDILAGSSNVTVGVLNVSTDEAAVLTGLRVNATGPLINFASTTGSNVSIWDGATLVGAGRVYAGAASPSFYVPLTNLNVAAGSNKVLTIKTSFAFIPPGLPGDKMALNVSSLYAYTARNNQTAVVNGSTNFAGVSLHSGVPIITVVSTSTRPIQNGTSDLSRIRVTVPELHAPVKIEKVTFNVGTTTVNVSKFDVIGPNGKVSSSTLRYKPGTTLVEVPFDNPLNTADALVLTNTTKEYLLRAQDVQLIGANGTGAVGVRLKADTSYRFGRIGLQTDSKNNQYVVWSTSSSTPSTQIWANSYGLPGCFTLTSPIISDCPAGAFAR